MYARLALPLALLLVRCAYLSPSEIEDLDRDGYAAALFEGGADCDDLDPAVHPGAEEVWYDSIDQDCDTNDCDQDGDGVDAALCGGDDCDDEDPLLAERCGEDNDQDGAISVPSGGDDCDDDDPAVHPGAEEIWYDGIDQNCDENDCDRDLDGQEAKNIGVCSGEDCDDSDPEIPRAIEIVNGVDDDCDGISL